MGRSARTNPHPDLFAGLEPDNKTDAKPANRTPSVNTADVVAPAVPARAYEPLWVCVHFPSLPLQALREQCSSERACVVCEPDQRKRIVATNRMARDAGVLPGQPLKSALALCADLDIVDREPARESALLQQIAERLVTFSNSVSIQAPQSVLVEIRGSLRLFGGVESLLARMLGALKAEGYHLRHSIAPTAIGAYWLVQAGVSPAPEQVAGHGRESAQFQRLLNALDIAVTDWPQTTQDALRQMGVDSIADCRRLPRDGLARRFGPALLHQLAQAFGELPEARRHIKEPQCFDGLLELDAEISDATQLHTGCARLLSQLADFLRRRQGAVRQIDFVFHGWRDSAGALSLSMSSAGFEQQHWLGLLAAHLERCQLSQPAVAITLRADISEPLRARCASLALESDTADVQPLDNDALNGLLDRLRARIGEDAVKALRHVSEHRPEYASRTVKPTAQTLANAALPPDWLLRDVPAGVMALDASHALLLQRPLWLTEQPVPLRLHDGVLYSEGALELRYGPERIEAGWWEDSGAVRDYFVAENPAGVRLWVFREPDNTAAARWWLHGIFG